MLLKLTIANSHKSRKIYDHVVSNLQNFRACHRILTRSAAYRYTAKKKGGGVHFFLYQEGLRKYPITSSKLSTIQKSVLLSSETNRFCNSMNHF